VDPKLGKVSPYGVYDLAANQGWVSVGIDHDTAELAAETIRCWWREMGHPLYPQAQRLLITADSGGSNDHRIRLWKLALQGLADQLGLEIWVCHFPPGTSKWNKIEHRMFCYITQNWRGRPLISRQVGVLAPVCLRRTPVRRYKTVVHGKHYASCDSCYFLALACARRSASVRPRRI
jgi:hypothetical protein